MGSTTVQLAFGREGLPLTLDDGVDATIVRKRPVPVSPDPSRLIVDALDSPIDAEPLMETAAGATTACILICDITRPVPNGLFLRPIIDRITGAGVPLDGITVLVATGLHRPNLGDELAEVVGDRWVLEHVRVVNHDARDDASHVMMGTTRSGTPVGIDRRFVEADLKIVTGLVEPHFMAGYSGGRKLVAPGVAHHSTIRTFHSARFMEHPAATSCNLDGNPLHLEQLEILTMLDGDVLALNTVLDEERRLVHVNYGDIVTSHDAAVSFVRDAALVELPHRFSTVVTSAAGHPLDATYYQTIKGMVTPLDILEPGGTLIVAADCGEGVGSPEFRASQQRLVSLGPDAFLDTIVGKQLADVDEWQTEMQLKAVRRGRVVLFAPRLSDDDHAITGVERTDDLDAAVRASIDAHSDRRVAVIPEGPYVIPVAVGRGTSAPDSA